MSSNIAKCGVIGNPIEHSLSPGIHSKFAQDTGILLEYSKYLVEEQELKEFVFRFFSEGGVGLNVTAPFKQLVLNCTNRLSESAKICQSVNTLSINSVGEIIGDTTDGEGILLDLNRLGFATENRKVLILGAGGATLPVALALMKNQCHVSIHNRTQSKVDELVKRLSPFGAIHSFDPSSSQVYDGLISAVSRFNSQLLDPALSRLKSDGFGYDLNYSERAKTTLDYMESKGVSRLSDGYGMLIGQAARSFQIWHGIMPPLKLD